MIHPHGTESGDYYKQMYVALLGGMIRFIEETVQCDDDNCELCTTLKAVCSMLCVSFCTYKTLTSLS